jgi:hypothetical protein
LLRGEFSEHFCLKHDKFVIGWVETSTQCLLTSGRANFTDIKSEIKKKLTKGLLRALDKVKAIKNEIMRIIFLLANLFGEFRKAALGETKEVIDFYLL